MWFCSRAPNDSWFSDPMQLLGGKILRCRQIETHHLHHQADTQLDWWHFTATSRPYHEHMFAKSEPNKQELVPIWATAHFYSGLRAVAQSAASSALFGLFLADVRLWCDLLVAQIWQTGVDCPQCYHSMWYVGLDECVWHSFATWNLVIKHLWQRSLTEAGYFTFQR